MSEFSAFDLFDTANDETASLSTWRSLPCNRLAASSGSLAEVISGLAYLEADSARTALGLYVRLCCVGVARLVVDFLLDVQV